MQSVGQIAAIAVVAALSATGVAFGQAGTGTFRVAAGNGIDWEGCGSENDPCQKIQMAVNLAGHDDRILVAAGTYTFDEQLSQCTTGNSAVVCIVNKRLTIEGGHTPSDWTVSDPVSNLTVIDGENARRGIIIEEGSDGSASLTMRGVTVTRCLGIPREGDVNSFGGGLSAVAPDPQKLVVVLEDMVFSGNRVVGGDASSGAGGFGAGGAVSLRNIEAPSRLVNVEFSDNQAVGGSGPSRGGLAVGGAIYSYQSTASGADLVFSDNSARAGQSNGSGSSGGLLADALGGAVALMSDSSFDLDRIAAIGNSAFGGQAATYGGGAFGGALYAEGPDANHLVTMNLTDATLFNNTAVGGAGENGGLGNGGAMMNSKNVNLVFNRVQVLANSVYGGNGTVNRGGSGGGGVKSTGGPVAGSSSAVFTNCIFADNSVHLGSGGGSKGGGGGGLFVQNLSTAIVRHCTFARNSLSALPLTGLAITLAGGAAPVTLRIAHSIIADHTDTPDAQAVFAAEFNTAVYDTGLLAGNIEETGGLGEVFGIESMQVAPSAGFFSPGAPRFDYHLVETSPAIGQAFDSTTPVDIDGDSRGQEPDLGADEYSGVTGALFLNGFEFGDFSAWSHSVP